MIPSEQHQKTSELSAMKLPLKMSTVFTVPRAVTRKARAALLPGDLLFMEEREG